ncbi:MAG: hypothetical protein ABUL62_31835 [Myxococcales bacterium]
MPNQAPELKIATEVAEAEFDRFAAAMDFDLDAKAMDEDDRKAFAATKRTVVRSIEQGHLVVDDSGQPVFTPQLDDKSPITFYEPKGISLLAMEARKKGEDVSKMFASMGNMTKQHPSRFVKMSQRDLRVCMALATLFLS